MKLKYSVIGDNTSKNREWLEKIGYKPDEAIESYEFELLIANHEIVDDGYYSGIDKWYIDEYKRLYNNTINCIGNDALFRAVSALREDSDENQWLTNDRSWIKAENVSINDKSITDYSELFKGFHKATLAELQEHFKK